MTTAAAAAALSRSRGVAGVGTKGLFFVFTLLCLVCLSSSLIDKNQVKQLVETYQNAQQDLNKVKAEYMSKVSTTSDLMKDSMDIMESMKAWMKTLVSAAPGVFPPVGKYMESMHDYMQKTKDEVDGENEALLAKIKRSEEELGKMKKLIQALEEYQAEL
ncbi:hypothetical protein Q5P01_002303 [Channa striata]|uniref:Uncharacterized protein n=1 Tax=Channa striata TaxID=64152 RepID=A0AA88NQT5_CHASR|nr:hypothetical protein Q5P01_002303 [Channa striata]